jgi:hypothetical protein
LPFDLNSDKVNASKYRPVKIMTENNIIHILVAPPEKIETSLVKEVAGILQKDPYETRLLLSGVIPKLFGHYQSIKEAEDVTARLKALGLTVVVSSDTDLRQSKAGHFTAHALTWGDHDVTFLDKTGRTLKIENKNVFLILKGKFFLYSDKEITTTKMKFSLSGTLMTGGFPVWRKVQERSKDTSTEVGYFVRLYDRVWIEPRVEIIENNFDYSSLGANITPSSFTNFNALVTQLKSVFPTALYDDRLSQPAGASSFDRAEETELNCKLVYLSLRAVDNPGALK